MEISERQNCSTSHFPQYPFSPLGYINPEEQPFLWNSQECEQTKPEGKSQLTPLALRLVSEALGGLILPQLPDKPHSTNCSDHSSAVWISPLLRRSKTHGCYLTQKLKARGAAAPAWELTQAAGREPGDVRLRGAQQSTVQPQLPQSSRSHGSLHTAREMLCAVCSINVSEGLVPSPGAWQG